VFNLWLTNRFHLPLGILPTYATLIPVRGEVSILQRETTRHFFPGVVRNAFTRTHAPRPSPTQNSPGMRGKTVDRSGNSEFAFLYFVCFVATTLGKSVWNCSFIYQTASIPNGSILFKIVRFCSPTLQNPTTP
jgi:hypothetical protein